MVGPDILCSERSKRVQCEWKWTVVDGGGQVGVRKGWDFVMEVVSCRVEKRRNKMVKVSAGNCFVLDGTGGWRQAHCESDEVVVRERKGCWWGCRGCKDGRKQGWGYYNQSEWGNCVHCVSLKDEVKLKSWDAVGLLTLVGMLKSSRIIISIAEERK